MLSLYLRDAWRGLLASPLKSGMTLISLMIGMAALGCYLHLNASAKVQFRTILKEFGTHVFTATLYGDQENSDPITLSNLKDFYRTQHDLKLYPYHLSWETLDLGGDEQAHQIVAVDEDMLQDFGWVSKLNYAPLFSRSDQIYLGHHIAEQYALKVQDWLYIRNLGYQVAGILPPSASNPLMDFALDDSVFVSLEAFIGPQQLLDHFLVHHQGMTLHEAEQTFKKIIAHTYGAHTSFFRDANLYQQALQQSVSTHSTLLVWGAVIILSLGLLGILSQQTLSFLERRGELGMRLSLGATRWDIFWLFVIESSLLGLFGAFLGLMVAWALFYACTLTLGWPYQIFAKESAFTVILGSIASALSGLAPAAMAARSQPTKLLAYS